MRRNIFYGLLVLSVCARIVHAQGDSLAYRAAESITSSSERIQALEKFVTTYPTSRYAGNASLTLFNLYAEQKTESPALESARRYLETLAPGNRMGPYNQIAYTLAVNSIGLDSALAYASRSADMARTQGSTMLSAIEDTRALVLYRRGDAAEAKRIQQAIMPGHEDDPEYLGHLSLYQAANGKRREALQTVARALYIGGTDDLRSQFADWLHQEAPDSASRDALKQSIVMGVVRSLFDSLSESQVTAIRSSAARFMAAMGVHLPTAHQWAKEAIESIGNKTPVETAITYKKNLALVTAAAGNYQDALALLRSVQDYVTPWDSDFWIALGSTSERSGDQNGAINAYIQGLTVMNAKDLRQALNAVYTKVHGSLNGLEVEIDKAKQRDASIDPGRADPSESRSGRVVLAELFTGAECGPCVGADMAFDALREYYPTSDLAILEYHVHIPGPDPLTTNDSWDRYQRYKGTGTPTVVIDGSEKFVGAGPKYIARNRFNVYRYAIDAAASMKSPVALSATGRIEGDKIHVGIRVERTGASPILRSPSCI